MLAELQGAIASEQSLDELNRAEALEQLEALAIAAQNPSNADANKTIRRAIKILVGTFTGPIAPAALKESGTRVLPALAELFGL